MTSDAMPGGRLAWPWRLARTVATLAAAVVLAGVVAHWGWRWLGPESVPLPPVTDVPASPAAAILATPWFGAADKRTDLPAARAPAAHLPGDARLLGIIAGRDGTGYALFRFVDRGPVLVATGGEIAPGVTLQTVSAAGARISDGGEARDLLLRPEGGQARSIATPARPAVVAAASTNPACVPPGGATTAPYRLNAELLGGIAARPATWSDAFTVGSNGLSMREGNAFGTMLGMRPGDRVAQANGVPLRGADDVLVGVIRPLLANQAVRVTGLREGRPIEWIFVNAGACPP